jgi:hypothetical protein
MYHTLLSFHYPNRDLDKLTLANFGPIALRRDMAMSDLEDTRRNAREPSYDPNSLCVKTKLWIGSD